MSSTDDFGFTFENDEATLTNLDKANALYQQILPFLKKLKGDKAMDVIKWPGEKRHKEINDFISKLEGIMYDKKPQR